MRTPPQPASVFDADERGNPILHSKRSATRVTKRHSDPRSKRTKHEAKASPEHQSGKSQCRGSVKDLVTSYTGTSILTVFSTGKDHSEQRNEIEGACYRKIFLTDETEILNPTATYERQRYVKLVILISHTDEIYENPTVFVEQRIYEDKQERAVVNELMFGTLVQLDLEYVFPGCGDEDRVLGKRDLVVRFQSLDESVFSEYISRARYYGYDRHDCVRVNQQMLSTGVDYSVSPPGAPTGASPCVGFLEGSDLQGLLTTKERLPQPDTSTSFSHDGIELIKLRFRKFGRWSEDGQYGGDLILHFVYSP